MGCIIASVYDDVICIIFVLLQQKHGRCPGQIRPGPCPTNDILIEFEIGPKFVVLWFIMYSTDHNKILHVTAVWLSWRVQNFTVID